MFGALKDRMSAASNPADPPHPFYPLEVDIVGYLANKWSVPYLLGIFLGGWLVILGLTWASVSWVSPQLRRVDKVIVLWFILSRVCPLQDVQSPTCSL
jgi:cholestenol Delta-isomerase